MTTAAPHRTWLAVLLVFAGGIAAAMQLGKVAQVMPALTADLGLSLVEGGWAVSLIALLGALFGVSAASLMRGFGLRRALIAGLAILALGGAAEPFATGAASFLVARFLEGVGYLMVVVAAPALLAVLAQGRGRAWALALWASFVVLGYAAVGLVHGAVAPVAGWRVEFGLLAALAALFALLTPTLVPATAAEERPGLRAFLRGHAEAYREGTALRLALAFGLYVILSISFFSFLPTQLIAGHGMSTEMAGQMGALVAIAAVPGNLVGAELLRRGASGAVVGGGALAAMAVLAFAVYGTPDPALTVLAGAAFALVNGVAAAACFATMPRLFADPSRIPLGFGLIAQMGSLGTLVGPPLVAWSVEAGGWDAVPYLFAVLAVAGVGLFATLGRRVAVA